MTDEVTVVIPGGRTQSCGRRVALYTIGAGLPPTVGHAKPVPNPNSPARQCFWSLSKDENSGTSKRFCAIVFAVFQLSPPIYITKANGLILAL